MEYSLKIGQFGCLADLELDFSTGLNVITGAHGAGKSTLLRALQTTLFDRAFGSKHKQMGKTGYHAIALKNHVFDVQQGHNEHEGRYFRGVIGGQQLQGEYPENHAKFLRYFDVDSAAAWETLKERVLFYDETKTLLDKDDRGIVAALTKILGRDSQRTQTACERIKKQASDLKVKIDKLKDESRASSGLQLASTTEYEERAGLLWLQVVGTLRPFELPYEKKRLAEVENEQIRVEKEFGVYRSNNEKQIAALQAKLTGEQFDEVKVKQKRDELIGQLFVIQKLIQQTQRQITEPLDCPACHAGLLWQDDSLVLANTAAIETAKNDLARLQSQETKLALEKSTCDDQLAQIDIRKQVEKLQSERKEKESAHEAKRIESVQKVVQHDELIKKSDAAQSVWQEIEKLERTIKDIQDNNGRYDRFLEIQNELTVLEPEFARQSFMASPNGFVLFRNQEFMQQAGQYSRLINDTLGALSLGKIEFEPVFEEDGSILRVKVFHFDPNRKDWRELDERESSLNVILSFCAFLAQRKLNPQKIDELELIMIDDLPHLSDPKRLAPLLEYINQLPLVTVLSWSMEMTNLVRPAQIIKL